MTLNEGETSVLHALNSSLVIAASLTVVSRVGAGPADMLLPVDAEVLDRMVIGAAGVSALLMPILGLTFRKFRSKISSSNVAPSTSNAYLRRRSEYLSFGAFLALCAGISSQNHFPSPTVDNDWTKTFFSGFGFTSLILVLLLVAIAPIIRMFLAEPGNLWFLNWTSAAILLVSLLPAMVIRSGAVPFQYDYSFVMFELLGPLTSNPPIWKSVSQYSSLLGWPLVIFRQFPPDVVVELAYVYLSLLFVSMIVFFTIGLRIALPKLSRLHAFFFGSLLFLMRPNGSLVGSLTTVPSVTVRQVIPMFALVLVAKAITQNDRPMVSFAAGVALGLGYVNNFEYGVFSTFSAGLVVFVVTTRRMFRIRQALSIAVGFSSVVVVLFAGPGFGQRIQRHLLVASSYASGFGNISAPTVSLQLVTLALCMSAIASGLCYLLNSQKMRASSVVALLFGCFGLLSHFYFAGRSVVSIQLQSVIPVASLAFASAIGPYVHEIFRKWSKPTGGDGAIQVRHRAGPAMMLILLPFTLFLKLPSPDLEWGRLMGQIEDKEVVGNQDASAARFLESETLLTTQSAVDEFGRSKVGVLSTTDSAVFAQLAQVENLSPFADFAMLQFVEPDWFCSQLKPRLLTKKAIVVGPGMAFDKDQLSAAKAMVQDCLVRLSVSFREGVANTESPLVIELNVP